MAIRYKPNVYRAQGATKMVVASGGEIEVEDGGLVTFESGGLLTADSGSTIDIAGKLTVASGGTIEVESGSTCAVKSGGIIDVESGGVLQIGGTAAIDSLGYIYGVNGFRLQIERASSTAAALSTEGGLTFLTCSSNIEYTLPSVAAGMAGLVKVLIKTSATTTVLGIVNQPSSTLFWIGANDLISLGAESEVLTVVAGSTTEFNRWYYAGGLNSTTPFGAST